MKKTNFAILAQRRFKSADNDLKSARVILAEGGYLGTSCFLAQQIVEKYLKGFLIYHGHDPQKTHALLALLKRCLEIDQQLKTFEAACRKLDRYYIEPRYSDYPVEYSKKEANEALNDALRIREFVRKIIHIGD